jgi:hypothetical protein
MKEVNIGDTTYRYGQNAADNTELIKISNPEWFWFHLAKFPSCHVVVCIEGEINLEQIVSACALVKERSKYKFDNIAINYCRIKNLIHGKEPGSVYFASNKQVQTFNL